jgi:ribosomal protein S18 acetylase RimI-like enzyme
MTPADIAGCARWIAATPLWQRYHVTESSISTRLRQALEGGATIFVAECAGDVLGFLWLVERGAFDHSDYVRMIGVRPGERGRGVGHSLMEYAEGVSRAKGRDLFLLVSAFNTDAQRFYQRLGFHQVGLLEDYVIPGVGELIYRKRVDKTGAGPD